MSDNTVLNPGVDGDIIRDIYRASTGAKVQVVQLELGGGSANGEQLITAGQQAMAASVPVVLASNQTPIPVANPVATNVFGQALAVTAGATSALVSFTNNTLGFQIKGFVAHGTGDGYFTVQIGGVTVLSGRSRATMPTLVVVLPNGVSVPAGQVVAVKATNESGSTADFEATLLGA